MFSGGMIQSGKISDDTFRVPTDAILGTWTLKAQSGATNVGTTEFLCYRSDGLWCKNPRKCTR